MQTFVLKTLEEAEKKHPDWKGQVAKCKHLFDTCAMPDHEEVVFMAKVFQVRLEISYSSIASPVQCAGPVGAPNLCLSNEPCVDGAGNHVAHFRFLWKSDDEKANPKKSISPEEQQIQQVVAAHFSILTFRHLCTFYHCLIFWIAKPMSPHVCSFQP